MKTVVAVRGTFGTVEFLARVDGASDTKAVFDSLGEGDRTALHVAMQHLANNGPTRFLNRERFKKVDGAIFEFKRFQQRFLGACPSNRPGA